MMTSLSKIVVMSASEAGGFITQNIIVDGRTVIDR
jgi:hypothetical protein